MSDLINQGLAIFLGFFAIMNPIANTAVFAGLTANSNKDEQRRIAIKALLITFIVIAVFSLLGKTLFHLFGITLPALRITGGILVFLVGYHMLHGKETKMHDASVKTLDKNTGGEGASSTQKASAADIAISPLAVPLLAGPGTIATAMNHSASGGWFAIICTLVMFAALCLITLVCFIFSSKIIGLIGASGLSIVTRLMGLILAVIGVQMLIEGLLSALPGLAG